MEKVNQQKLKGLAHTAIEDGNIIMLSDICEFYKKQRALELAELSYAKAADILEKQYPSIFDEE